MANEVGDPDDLNLADECRETLPDREGEERQGGAYALEDVLRCIDTMEAHARELRRLVTYGPDARDTRLGEAIVRLERAVRFMERAVTDALSTAK